MKKQLADKFYMIMEDFRKFTFSKNHVGELTKSEFSMLHLIKHFEKELGHVTTSVLSEHLHISKPAISQMINILEEKQYIQRIIDKNDRRLMCVVLTESGNQAIEKKIKFLLNSVSLVFDKMGEKDSELFVELLSKYITIIKEIVK